jgi:hypothetical protein
MSTGTTPRFKAKARQITRPAAIPIGTPSTIPTTAMVVDCQHTAAPTWARTKPSTFSTATSLRVGPR